MEEWIDVKGYEERYMVSDSGKVYSKHFNKVVKLHEDLNGYLTVGLYKNSKQKRVKIHRLVAEHFIPNLDSKPQVNHKDGNRQNNHVYNLEWVTAQENVIHSYTSLGKKTNKTIGAEHSKARLSESEVKELRFRYKTEKISIKELAKQFGIGYTTANYAINRRSYYNVE